MNRSIQAEGAFGQLKHNRRFVRSYHFVFRILSAADLLCAAVTDKILVVNGKTFASSASRAFVAVKQYLFFKTAALGTVTPLASHTAPFEEYGGSYAGSVDVRISFDIKYRRLHCFSFHFVLSMIMSCHSLFIVTNLAFQPETRTDRF